MLKFLFGNRTVEKILYFLQVYEEGYARRMAEVFEIPVNGIQQQLKRLEMGGIVVGRLKGKTRIYQFNPSYPFLKELKALLARAMEYLPNADINRYFRLRTRPRRSDKP